MGPLVPSTSKVVYHSDSIQKSFKKNINPHIISTSMLRLMHTCLWTSTISQSNILVPRNASTSRIYLKDRNENELRFLGDTVNLKCWIHLSHDVPLYPPAGESAWIHSGPIKVWNPGICQLLVYKVIVIRRILKQPWFNQQTCWYLILLYQLLLNPTGC